MRYAIVSDIHANQQAWKAVLLDIRSTAVDKIICLGDIIGYGPNPVEILESLYETVDYFVLGNHDAALCGKIDTFFFNTCARDMITWTHKRVGEQAIRFLSEQPLTLVGPGFRCAHGDLADPGRFCYVFEPDEALSSWNAVPEPLLFIGHTHRPCIIVLGKSGIPRMIEPEDFVLEEGKRFLVNVGSVGQPRQRDTRASYCLYDSQSGSIYWRRIPFDLDAFRNALVQAGISMDTNPFLEFDPLATRQPLRDLVPFKPPAEPVRDTLEVQYVDILLQHKVRKWKTLFWSGVGLLAIAGILAGWMWIQHRSRVLDLSGTGMSAIRAEDFALESNLLSFPEAPIPTGDPVPSWNIHLGDRFHQQAAWGLIGEENHGFILRSDSSQSEIRLASQAVHVSPNMRLSIQARVKKSPHFSGSVAIAMALVQKVGTGLRPVRGRLGEASLPRERRSFRQVSFETNQHFIVKEPTIFRQDGWSLAKQTKDLPARSHSVILQIRGKFEGTVFIRDIRLERKK